MLKQMGFEDKKRVVLPAGKRLILLISRWGILVKVLKRWFR